MLHLIFKADRRNAVRALQALACGIIFAPSLSLAAVKAGEWSVSAMGQPSKTGVFTSSCAAKQSFANGDMFVLARNLSGGMSAVLRRGERVKAGEGETRLILSVDGHDFREVMAKTAPNGDMVFALGHDYHFFDTLKGGHALDFDIPDQGTRVSYSLKGSANALRALNSCLVKLNGGQRLAFVPDLAPPPYNPMKVRPQYGASSPFTDPTRAYLKVTRRTKPARSLEPIVEPKAEPEAAVRVAPVKQVVKPAPKVAAVPVQKVEKTVLSPLPVEATKMHDLSKIEPAAGTRMPAIKDDVATYVKPVKAPTVQKLVEAPKIYSQCKLGEGVAVTGFPLRARLHNAALPALRLAAQNTVSIPLNANESVAPVKWSADSINGYFAVLPSAKDVRSIDETQKVIVGDLKAACPGDFAVIPVSNSFKSGIHQKDIQVACMAPAGQVVAHLSFYSDGFETAVFSFETDSSNLSQVIEYKRDLSGLI